jgi:hypothetical protein
VVYQSIDDPFTLKNRGPEWLARAIKEYNITSIFRAFWKRNYGLDRYITLRDTVAAIRNKVNVTLIGALPAQTLWRDEYDLGSNARLTWRETWNMALDPSKWGIKIDKWNFQCKIAKARGVIDECLQKRPWILKKYFPDITNREFQRLFLKAVEAQIKAGIDWIWIDMLFAQTRIFLKITNDPSHPSVRDSFNASLSIIKRIKDIGKRYGKNVKVGSWIPPFEAPLDFVTVSISKKEVLNGINESKWKRIIEEVRERVGNVPIIAFLDWGPRGGPLDVFSTLEDQGERLMQLCLEMRKLGVSFAVPLHGGFTPSTVSFGYHFYDALAPEHNIAEYIKLCCSITKNG